MLLLMILCCFSFCCEPRDVECDLPLFLRKLTTAPEELHQERLSYSNGLEPARDGT
jgi:hypothetical protein